MTTQPVKTYVCYIVFRAGAHDAGKSAWAKWRQCGVYENLDCASSDAVELKRQNPTEVVCVLAYDQITGWRTVRCYAPADSKIGLHHVQNAHAYIPQRDYWQLMETMARMALFSRDDISPGSITGDWKPQGPSAKDHADAPKALPGEETFDLSGA